jgi:autotransporter-associated beta strand protein
MSTARTIRLLAAAVALLWLTSPVLAVSPAYWDPLMSSSGSGSGGSGTWDSTSAIWYNGVSDVVWPGNNYAATFAGTAGTVSLTTAPSTPDADGLVFSTLGYFLENLSGVSPTLDLLQNGSGDAITVNAGDSAVIRNVPSPGTGTLTLRVNSTGNIKVGAGGSLTIDSALNITNQLAIGGGGGLGAGDVTINGNIRAAAGTAYGYLNKYTGGFSTGTLTLGGDNRFAAGNILTMQSDNGKLMLNSANALGNATNYMGLVINDGTVGTSRTGAGNVNMNTAWQEGSTGKMHLQAGDGTTGYTLTFTTGRIYGTQVFPGIPGSTSPTFDVTAGNVIFSGVLQGAVTLTKTGAGALSLSGDNSSGGIPLSGTVSVGTLTTAGGALLLGHANALGSATLVFNNASGSVGAYGSSPITVANTWQESAAGNMGFAAGNVAGVPLTLSAGRTLTHQLTVDAAAAAIGILGGNLNFTGVGSPPLTKTGTGTLALTGTNAFLAGSNVTMSGGGLLLGSAAAIGGAGGATLVFNGGGVGAYGTSPLTLANTWTDSGSSLGFIAGDLTLSASRTLASATNINVAAGAKATFTGNLTSSLGTLTKSGTGTLALLNSNTISNSPTLTMDGTNGTLLLGNNNALGSGPGSATLALGDGATIGAAGASAIALGNNWNWQGVPSTLNFVAGSLQLSATPTISGGAGSRTVNVRSGATAILNGALSLAGSSLTKTGPGKLTLGGSGANTQTTTIVNAGPLELSKSGAAAVGDTTLNYNPNPQAATSITDTAAGQFATTANVTVNGGVINLGIFSETVRSLTLAATGTIQDGALTVTNTTNSVVMNAPQNLLATGTISGKLTVGSGSPNSGEIRVTSGTLALTNNSSGTPNVVSNTAISIGTSSTFGVLQLPFVTGGSNPIDGTTNPVTLINGGLLLSGSPTGGIGLNNPVTVAGNGVIQNGSAAATLSTMTINAGASLSLDPLTTTPQPVTVTALNLSGSGAVTLNGGALSLPAITELSGAAVPISITGGNITFSAAGGTGSYDHGGSVFGGTLVISNALMANNGTLIVDNVNALRTTGALWTVGPGGTIDTGAIAAPDLSRVVVNPGGKLSFGTAPASGITMPAAKISGSVEFRAIDLPTSPTPIDGLKLGGGGTLAYVMSGADHTYSGTITLVDPNKTVYLTSSGNNLNLSGAIGPDAGVTGASLAIPTGNAGTIRLQSAENLNAPIHVEGGSLNLQENGSLLLVPTVNVYGGTFNAFDNSGTSVITPRLKSNVEVNLYGGTLGATIKAGASFADTIDTVKVSGGAILNFDSGGADGNGLITINNFNVNSTANGTFGGAASFTGTPDPGQLTGTRRVNYRINNINGTPTTTGTPPSLSPNPLALINGLISGSCTITTSVGGVDFATIGLQDPGTLNAAPVATRLNYSSTNPNPSSWLNTDNVKVSYASTVTLGANALVNALRLDNTTAGAGEINLGSNILKLTSGGLLSTGSQNLNVTSATGTLTAGTATGTDPAINLAFLSAAGSGTMMDVQAKIADNVGTSGTQKVGVLVSGGRAVRLENTANSFTGGVFVLGGTLEAGAFSSANPKTGSVLGAISGPGLNTITLYGGTLNLRDNGPTTPPVPAILSYNNPIVVNNNATISLDRIDTGAAAAYTYLLGPLTLDTGRQLTISNANSYMVQFNSGTQASMALSGVNTLNVTATIGAPTTANPNTASVIIGDPTQAAQSGTLSAAAGSQLIKSGAGTVLIHGHNAAAAADLATTINAGFLKIDQLDGLGTYTNGATITVNNGGGLELGGTASGDTSTFNFGPAPGGTNPLVTLNPGAGLRLSWDQAGTKPSVPLGLLEVNANITASTAWNGLQIAPGGTVRSINSDTVTPYAFAPDLVLLGPTTLTNSGGANAVIFALTGTLSGPGGIIKPNSTVIVSLRHANTYAGGSSVTGGVLRGAVAGALSNGPVGVSGGGTLDLYATGAANNNVTDTNGTVNYNANNAAGGNSTIIVNAGSGQTAEVQVLGTAGGTPDTYPGVTVAPTDFFDIHGLGDVIRGDALGGLGLPLLTRYTDSTSVGNVLLATDSIVAHNTVAAGNPVTIQNLGTAEDLYFGLGATFNNSGTTLTIGPGTPWKGISPNRSGSRSFQQGTIYLNDGGTNTVNFLYLANRTLTIGNPTGTVGVNILKGGTNPVAVNLVNGPGNTTANVTLDNGITNITSSNFNFSGVSKFVVPSGTTLLVNRDYSLGGVGVATTIELQSGGTLTLPAYDNTIARTGKYFENGTVHILSGAVFNLNQDAVLGAGTSYTVNVDAGGIINLSNAGALRITPSPTVTGPAALPFLRNTQPIPISSGALIRLSVDDIDYLDAINAGAILEISGAVTGNARNFYGLTTTGGRGGPTLNNGAILTQQLANNRTIQRNPGLATDPVLFIGSGGGTIASTTGNTLTVANSISATGNPAVAFNTTATVDGLGKLGTVILQGTLGSGSNRVGAASVAGGLVTFRNNLLCTSLTLDAGAVTLDPGTSNTLTATDTQVLLKADTTLTAQSGTSDFALGPITGQTAPMGTIVVQSGATLAAGQLNNLTAVNLNGSATAATLTLNNRPAALTSNAPTLAVAGTNPLAVLNIGDNQTLNVTSTSVPAGGTLTVNGGLSGGGAVNLGAVALGAAGSGATLNAANASAGVTANLTAELASVLRVGDGGLLLLTGQNFLGAVQMNLDSGTATFKSSGGANLAISVAAAKTAGINVDPTFTEIPGSLTVGNNATINLGGGGTLTLNSTTLGTAVILNKTGTGSLIINGGQTWGAGSSLRFGGSGVSPEQAGGIAFGPTAVPEPSAFILLIFGGALCICLTWLKRLVN